MLNTIAQEELAEPWDNVGLLVGSPSWPVKRILIAVDLSNRVIEEAKKKKINLIITHHPIMFQKLQKINGTQLDGNKVIELIQNNIALYTLHTNFDASNDGTAVTMGELLELDHLKPVEGKIEGKYIRVGKLKQTLDLEAFLVLVKKQFNVKYIQTIGNKSMVNSIAVCPGSCFEIINQLDPQLADVFLTGELKYHEASILYEKGYVIFSIGHFESERPGMEKLASSLQKRCYELEYNLRTYLSEKDFSPIVFQ
jgi:dinuclear metal center YbgI/SA1388 family protein